MSGSSAITLLGSAFIAILVAGYIAQRSLPPPRPKVVGIDLGTTYSCIGTYQAVTGAVVIYPDEGDHRCIPSVVAFTEDDKILVGYKAVAQQEHNPSNTVYDAKRFIGKSFTEEQLAAEARRYPFKLERDDEGMVRFTVQHKGKIISVRPEEIGGYIIKTLHENMARNVTADSVPSMAVVSVPAEFNSLQRNYTMKAVHLGGFSKVLRVINEPTAAALAYGLHKKSGISNVLVVDLGGGTLDVSLLSVQGGMFNTMAMAGNNHLGGQDFNEELHEYLLRDINKHYNATLTDPEDLQVLSTAVESSKIDLTSSQSTHISIKLHSLNVTYNKALTRMEFEAINDKLFKKVIEPIEAILDFIESDRSSVDEIVMVGGSTRIPRIRELISKYFNKKLNTSVDADLAVVTGVAIQAGILGGNWPLTVSAIEVPTSVRKIVLT